MHGYRKLTLLSIRFRSGLYRICPKKKGASRSATSARREAHLKARLKRYPQPKLDLCCVERIERAGDFAEGAICHIRIYSTQIAVIKDVQKIKAELQVALFPSQGKWLFFRTLAST